MTAGGVRSGPGQWAVVGAGWAGLAAAVRAVQAGHQVTLFERAAHAGGRARSVRVGSEPHTQWLDNGQHILIGAYRQTLALMRSVGVDPQQVLHRQPLLLQYADGRRFALPPGPQALAFAQAVWACQAWTLRDRLSLLIWSAGRAFSGFTCPPDLSVAQLCQGLAPRVREMLIDPLCVAALNTHAGQASAQVLLRVLKDALLGGPGSADLLLPRAGLDRLLPEAALAWLTAHGAKLRLGHGVRQLQLAMPGPGCLVDEEPFDRVVLACTATEAARLVQPLNAAWSAQAAALRYEPIITVYLRAPGARLPAPMVALTEGPQAPAQFVFDHGALFSEAGRAQRLSHQRPDVAQADAEGRFAFVVSGAAPWVEKGLQATADAVLRQAHQAFLPGTWPEAPVIEKVLAEKRATFRCTPGLRRPPARIHAAIAAAGDYVQGPYPATLEAAVRAGEQAVELLMTGR